MTRISARRIQIALGLLWLLDGALQLQPYMFSSRFATDVLMSAASGQPSWLAGMVNIAAHQIAANPVVWNLAFAVTQLALGVGFLVPRLVRPAIVASTVWAVAVWGFGEGFGGLLSAHASLITGAPGAALLYAVLAVAVWPRRAREGDTRGTSDARVASWFPIAWLVTWLAGAVLQLLPGQNHPADVSAAVAGGAMGSLAPVQNAAAGWITAAGAPLFVILVTLMVAIGIGGMWRGRVRALAAAVGAAVAFVFWMLGEGFGQLDSGHATDPNSGPLLMLMAIALVATPVPTMARTRAPIIRPVIARFAHRLSPARPRALLAALGIVVAAGVASVTATRGIATTDPMSMQMQMAPAMPMSAAAHDAAPPSASAQMVCASETRRNVQLLAGLAVPPTPAATWSDHVYTCTYSLPDGRLAPSVEDAPDVAAARAYFGGVRAGLGNSVPINGLAALGLPASTSPSGVVVFLKDDKTLVVDARGLSGDVGPNHQRPQEIAYALASDVIGCWTGG